MAGTNSSTLSTTDAVEIEQVSFYKYGASPNEEPINLLFQLLTLEIYENINCATVYCNLGISDGVGILNSVQFGDVVGEEMITIKFRTKGSDTYIEHDFFVFACTQAIPNDQSRNISFYLKCVTLDFLNSFNTFVAKGYNETYDVVVKDILQNELKTNVPLTNVGIEKTKGAQQIVIPKLNAFNAIDFARSRSVAMNSYSPFLFFQNRRGYNFVSLSSLIDRVLDGKDGDPPKYTYGDISWIGGNIGKSPTLGDVDREFYSIISINNEQRFNTLAKIKEGAFNNFIQRFDLVTKEYTSSFFRLNDHKEKFKFNNANIFNSKGFVDEYEQGSGTSFFFVEDSSKPETFFSDSLGPKTSYAYLMNQNIVNVELHGNSKLTVGDTITLDVRTSISKNFSAEDNFFNGNFLISGLKHQVLFDTAGAHYKTFCTLIKGDTAKRIENDS